MDFSEKAGLYCDSGVCKDEFKGAFCRIEALLKGSAMGMMISLQWFQESGVFV